MKKLFLFAFTLMMSLSATRTFAQAEGSATLNITLSDVMSIMVTQPPSLDVNFDSEAKYTNGIKVNADDHIAVVSSGAYTVKAVAGDITGPSNLSAESVKLTTSIGGTNAGNTNDIDYVTDLPLPAKGSTALPVITAKSGSWSGTNASNKFKVMYNIGADAKYAGKATGVNTIPVIYTVTQP
ncbi:hypothetical protein [Pedobacter gandavensis]|uniref:hypothetical protein n=1 Tax=Pedobacter gandavensis TaxID=2679963 RepID=UPI00292EDD23|nr:hypothetical protein [Pedobacter gandavensis]